MCTEAILLMACVCHFSQCGLCRSSASLSLFPPVRLQTYSTCRTAVQNYYYCSAVVDVATETYPYTYLAEESVVMHLRFTRRMPYTQRS